MTEIATTAVVDKSVQLGSDVFIGPGCVIEADVVIGDGCELKSHVFIGRGTILGWGNRIFANCVLGDEPQILGDGGEAGKLIIGNENTFRENVTINRGSTGGGGKTVVGNNNYIMIGSHLGHDCDVEDNVVISNCSQIAGHNKIERNVWLSGYCGTHQFVTIGRFAYAAGYSAMSHDIPPFVRVGGGYPCVVRGLNVRGLQRGGFSEESISALDRAYRRLYRGGGDSTLAQAVTELLGEDRLDENVRYLLESLRRSSQHHLGRYRELFRGQASGN